MWKSLGENNVPWAADNNATSEYRQDEIHFYKCGSVSNVMLIHELMRLLAITVATVYGDDSVLH